MKTREELILYLDTEFLINNDKNASVQIPNEIFIELYKLDGIKNAKQLAFCFSYLVINAFLSKYCSYWDYDGQEFITKKDIKVILGYSRENKTINHLIKVNGVLENSGFLNHETDIPVFHGIEKKERVLADGTGFLTKDWVLSYISDMPKQMQDDFRMHKSKGNPKFEAPIPSFISGTNDYQNTMNDRYSTFTIDYKMLRLMLFEDGDFTLIDLLILYFVRHICYNGSVVEMSYEEMLRKLDISPSTLGASLKKLQDKKMIEIIDTGFTFEKQTNGQGEEVDKFKRNARGYKVLSRKA